MADAGGDDYYIAALNIERDAGCVTKTDFGRAAINAEHFVRGAVVVGEWINAVPPRCLPSTCWKEFLKHYGGITRFKFHRLPVNQQRQVTIVWYFTGVFEMKRQHLDFMVHEEEFLSDTGLFSKNFAGTKTQIRKPCFSIRLMRAGG